MAAQEAALAGGADGPDGPDGVDGAGADGVDEPAGVVTGLVSPWADAGAGGPDDPGAFDDDSLGLRPVSGKKVRRAARDAGRGVPPPGDGASG